jgi:hypothetical protein
MSTDSETTNPMNNPELLKAYVKASEQDQGQFKSTYYMDIEQENLRRLEALSPLDEFEITFPPDYDTETWEIKAPDYKKVFVRRKVNRKAYSYTEALAAMIMTRRDAEERNNLIDKRYRYQAKLFLEEKGSGKPMTDEDFNRADWEQLKYIILACQHAYVHGRLPLPKRSGIS